MVKTAGFFGQCFLDNDMCNVIVFGGRVAW